MSLSPHNSPLVTEEFVFESNRFPLAVKQLFGKGSPGRHQHEHFHEIVLIVSGSAKHIYGEKSYKLQPQELLISEPGMYHNYEECEFDYYNLLVDFNKLKLPLFDLPHTAGFQKLFVLSPRSHCNKKGKAVRNFLNAGEFAKAIELLKKMHDFQSRRENGYQWAMVSLFQAFMLLICQGDRQVSEQNQIQPTEIGELVGWLTKHCEKDWTVQRMCQASRKSRPTLFREFKKFYGVSPMQFLTNQRMRKACALLTESAMSMEAIATACGFESGTYFSTIFKKNMNITPLRYRKNAQNSSGALPDFNL
ncbi:MAG: helix-turn-helix domain-containing protein [Lentisphaerae bacterium]|nr:helix-turn-helix domain-containing protein [Lentisphaerota bacterium]